MFCRKKNSPIYRFASENTSLHALTEHDTFSMWYLYIFKSTNNLMMWLIRTQMAYNYRNCFMLDKWIQSESYGCCSCSYSLTSSCCDDRCMADSCISNHWCFLGDEANSDVCLFSVQCAILSPAFKVREFSITDVVPYPVSLKWNSAAEEGLRLFINIDCPNSWKIM